MRRKARNERGIEEGGSQGARAGLVEGWGPEGGSERGEGIRKGSRTIGEGGLEKRHGLERQKKGEG